MDKNKAAYDIIAATLPHVAFDGWTMRALARGAEEAGYQQGDLIRIFPEGQIQAVETYWSLSDLAMEEALAEHKLEGMRIRDKIALAVRLRLEVHSTYPEALKRAVMLLSLPFYLPRALYCTAQTSDRIWKSIGDKSSDFNFYSKRATLAAVIMTTMQYWLYDHSPAHQDSWEFLNRRIENVMQFEKFKSFLLAKVP